MKIGIQIVLWVASIFFAYKIYDSINGPIKFNEEKNVRYAKVINRLKDIRTAQIAHRDVKGVFSNNFDSLIKFIDEGQFTLIEKRDSSFLEYDRTYRIDMLREIIVIDTLGTVTVKDSLFKNTDRYKNLKQIKIGDLIVPITLKTSSIVRNETKVSTFQCTIDKNLLLSDLDQDLVASENKVEGIDKINGDQIILGSLDEASVTGNWPKKYGSNE